MATRRINLTVEKMNRAIDVINIYLSSDTSKVFHEFGIIYLLKDLYNNMFNYIFLPVLKDLSDDFKLYFKYITIVFYQPPRMQDGICDYDTTYYFTYYYLKFSLIYFKRILAEFKLKTLEDLTKEMQVLIQLGIHFIFEIIYNNYRHDRIEEYIDKMVNPTPKDDFWKSIICGYLIETLIGIYAKDSFVIIHINGGPDIIDVEYPDRIKYFEVKSSAGGEYGCQSFLDKNKFDISRPYDCLSVEHITRLDSDIVLRFHIQVNKLEPHGPEAYMCDDIKTIDVNASRLNDNINTCLKHLKYLFNDLSKFRDSKLSINLDTIQIKYKKKQGFETLKFTPALALINDLCIHTWSHKIKSRDKERKDRIAFNRIGNIGKLPDPVITNIRTNEQSKLLLETRTLDETPMLFNIHSIQPTDDPTHYPNLNQNGKFDSSLIPEIAAAERAAVERAALERESIERSAAAEIAAAERAAADRAALERAASDRVAADRAALDRATKLQSNQEHENLTRISNSTVIEPSINYFNIVLLKNNISLEHKFFIYMNRIGYQFYPFNEELRQKFINEINIMIIKTNPHAELILLHILYKIISLRQQNIAVSPNEIKNSIIILTSLVNKLHLLPGVFDGLSENTKNIILSYNPNTIIRPQIYGNNLVINVNGQIYNII